MRHFIPAFCTIIVAAACGGGDAFSPVPSVPSATALAAVELRPSGKPELSDTVRMRFNGAMRVGMEQYVQLHIGSFTGLVMPMQCTWSTDATTLDCTPGTNLAHGTTYVLHMGAGMIGEAGTRVDMQPGIHMGGTWVSSQPMGGMHEGTMTGSHWQDSQGHQGIAFSLTP